MTSGFAVRPVPGALPTLFPRPLGAAPSASWRPLPIVILWNLSRNELVAQSVEQRTFNAWVVGSISTELTTFRSYFEQFRNYCGLIKIVKVWFSLGENHEKAFASVLHQLRNCFSSRLARAHRQTRSLAG